MDKIKVLVAAGSEEKRFELKNILTHEEIAIVGFSKPGIVVLEKAGSLQPDVIVMVYDKDEGDAAEVAERIYMCLPGCAVLQISENLSVDIIEKAMQAGVRKVLSWPVEQKTLIENIKFLHTAEKQRMSNSKRPDLNWQSKVITVFGTKGGIGKTTIAANLAVSLSRLGKKVALIDLDLQFGDVGIFLDIEPKDSIAELVTDRTSFDIDTVKSYMMLHYSGVSVLCAPKSPEYADIVTSEHISKIINTVRPYYDYVIIDTPPAFNDNTITAIEESNLVLFIITLEISTLKNAKVSINVFESLNQKDKLKIVVNRDQDGATITAKDASHVLKLNVFSRIHSDWKTAITALNKGIPIVIDSPRSLIKREFEELAKSIISNKGDE